MLLVGHADDWEIHPDPSLIVIEPFKFRGLYGQIDFVDQLGNLINLLILIKAEKALLVFIILIRLHGNFKIINHLFFFFPLDIPLFIFNYFYEIL